MRKTIVVYSGGLDSTVLLIKLRAEGRAVRALSINYGQRHRRELDHAHDICRALDIEHRVADLSDLKPLLAGSSQTDETVAVPHGHYAAENMKLTVVPFRNGLMLAVATAWAISTKADTVAYAAHFGDHAIYPDCREEFCRPFGEAMEQADWHAVQLERPFLNMTKAQIVSLGAAMKVEKEMAMSYSCYEGGVQHCALCGTCQERRSAFFDAHVLDLTDYDSAGLRQLPDSKLIS